MVAYLSEQIAVSVASLLSPKADALPADVPTATPSPRRTRSSGLGAAPTTRAQRAIDLVLAFARVPETNSNGAMHAHRAALVGGSVGALLPSVPTQPVVWPLLASVLGAAGPLVDATTVDIVVQQVATAASISVTALPADGSSSWGTSTGTHTSGSAALTWGP